MICPPAQLITLSKELSGTDARPTVVAYLHPNRLLRPHPGRVFVRHVQRLNIERVRKIQEYKARLTMQEETITRHGIPYEDFHVV